MHFKDVTRRDIYHTHKHSCTFTQKHQKTQFKFKKVTLITLNYSEQHELKGIFRKNNLSQ